jgi:hypothetical protein
MKPAPPIDQAGTAGAQAIIGPEAADGSPNISPDEERLDLIAEVHTRVLDAKDGFEKLVEKAEPKFRPVAQEFLALHSRTKENWPPTSRVAAGLRKRTVRSSEPSTAS